MHLLSESLRKHSSLLLTVELSCLMKKKKRKNLQRKFQKIPIGGNKYPRFFFEHFSNFSFILGFHIFSFQRKISNRITNLKKKIGIIIISLFSKDKIHFFTRKLFLQIFPRIEFHSIFPPRLPSSHWSNTNLFVVPSFVYFDFAHDFREKLYRYIYIYRVLIAEREREKERGNIETRALDSLRPVHPLFISPACCNIHRAEIDLKLDLLLDLSYAS